MDRERLTRIALTENRSDLPSAEDESALWFHDVGWQGLDALQNNCAVMIDMAHYVQTQYPEAVVVAEQLRLTARQIDWHVERIRLASKSGHLDACFTEYASRAIALYHGMTETLKALYSALVPVEGKQLEALL